MIIIILLLTLAKFCAFKSVKQYQRFYYYYYLLCIVCVWCVLKLKHLIMGTWSILALCGLHKRIYIVPWFFSFCSFTCNMHACARLAPHEDSFVVCVYVCVRGRKNIATGKIEFNIEVYE